MISRFLPHPVRRLLGVKTQHPRISGYTLIDQHGQMAPLLDAIEKDGEVVMDTEADNMYGSASGSACSSFSSAGRSTSSMRCPRSTSGPCGRA
jgi:hypothetical protein